MTDCVHTFRLPNSTPSVSSPTTPHQTRPDAQQGPKMSISIQPCSPAHAAATITTGMHCPFAADPLTRRTTNPAAATPAQLEMATRRIPGRVGGAPSKPWTRGQGAVVGFVGMFAPEGGLTWRLVGYPKCWSWRLWIASWVRGGMCGVRSPACLSICRWC